MSIYTLTDAQKYLDEALVTRSQTLKSQEYKLLNRSQRRVELEQLNADIVKWENEIKSIYVSNPQLNPNTSQKTRRGPTVSRVGYRR